MAHAPCITQLLIHSSHSPLFSYGIHIHNFIGSIMVIPEIWILHLPES